MLKATYWISVASVPILLVSAGCSLGPRPFSTARRGLPPERLMAMARTFERQGHYAQAKNAYLQVLASQPDYPDARQSLDTLIANEGNPDRLKRAGQSDQRQMIAKAKAAAERESRELALREEEKSSKLAMSDSAARVKKSRYEATNVSPDSTTATRIGLNTNSTAQSRETDDRLSDLETESPSLAAIEPTESRSSKVASAFGQVSDGAGNSQSTDPRSKSLTASNSTLIVSSNDSSAATRSVKADNANIHPADIESLDLLDSTPANESRIQRSVTRSADSFPVENSDERNGRNISSSVDVTDESDFRSIPVISSTPVAADSSQAIAGETDAAIQFEKPFVRDQRNLDSSLEPFFGPFHTGMVQDIRANRSQFQSKLTDLVADQNADCEVRSRAVFLLGSIGPAAAEALPTLRREMHYDVDEYLRVDLCEAILKIQPEDVDAITLLVDCLKETDEDLRWIAAFALRNAVSPNTTFVIESLLESLNTQDLKLRRMIFLTLAEFGPAAQKAIPVLEAALESPDPATREVAKASLACIAPDRTSAETIQKTSLEIDSTATK